MVKFSSCKSKSIPTWLFTLILVLWVTNSQATDSNVAAPWQQDWSGKLQVTPDMSLTLILHIKPQNDVYIASLDSVEQGAMGIPASKTVINGNKLVVEFATIGAKFSAKRNEEKLIGTFHQGGQKFSLKLTPISTQLKLQLSKAKLRPQEPKAPYPYIEEEVSYTHISGSFKFAGTLTKPKGKGPFAAAILVSGSGPQDRDSNLMNHKPFKVLADHLTRLGYAVLRADDRGTGKSEGTFNGSTISDFSYDVESAFNYLSKRDDIEHAKIGLIGHSEGGITSPIFAARQPKVAFVILLAGLGVSGTQLWATQQKELGELSGMKNGDEIYQLQFKAAKMAANQASFNELKTLFSTVQHSSEY